MSRVSTSRPKASVPSQWAALGRESMAPKSTATGLYGAITLADSASAMRMTTTTAPAAPSGIQGGPPPATPGDLCGGDLDGVERNVDRHTLAVPDPGVEPAVHDIHEEVDDD